MSAAGLRTAGSAAAAAGLLFGLAAVGRGLLLVALACALIAIAARPRWQGRLDVAAVLVGIVIVASALLAPAGGSALPMLTCVLVVCGAARLPPGVARALFAGCLALAVLVLALVSAFELAKSGELRSTTYPGLEGWGGFPEMGLLGVMALPVALGLALGGGPWPARAGAIVATVGAAAGVVLSGSRAAWGAALLGAILVLLAKRRGRWLPIAAVAMLTLAAAFVVVTIWRERDPAGGAVTLDVASRSRLEAWSQAAGLWRERPLIGWGPGSYAQVYVRHHERPAAAAQFHAHSAYLHLAVETGVLGVASVLWLGAAVLAGTGRRTAGEAPLIAAARIGLVCGLIAVGVRLLADYFDPAGAGMRVMLWLSILAGLRLALEAPAEGAAT